MNDQGLDALMQRALLDAIRREEQSRAETTVTFSPTRKYQRSIAAMLRNPTAWAKKRTRPLWKSVLQRAAVILLVVSLGFGSVMAISPTVRAAVVQWITEWYEEHITYRYAGEEIAGAMPQYEIMALPEGYVESCRIELPNIVSIEYLRENDETNTGISLTYTYMQDGSASDFLAEGAEVIPIIVNGLNGQLILNSDVGSSNSTVTWIDGEMHIQFEVSSFMEKKGILHIAESVSLVEK